MNLKLKKAYAILFALILPIGMLTFRTDVNASSLDYNYYNSMKYNSITISNNKESSSSGSQSGETGAEGSGSGTGGSTPEGSSSQGASGGAPEGGSDQGTGSGTPQGSTESGTGSGTPQGSTESGASGGTSQEGSGQGEQSGGQSQQLKMTKVIVTDLDAGSNKITVSDGETNEREWNIQISQEKTTIPRKVRFEYYMSANINNADMTITAKIGESNANSSQLSYNSLNLGYSTEGKMTYLYKTDVTLKEDGYWTLTFMSNGVNLGTFKFTVPAGSTAPKTDSSSSSGSSSNSTDDSGSTDTTATEIKEIVPITVTYTVKKNDYMRKIAREHGITLEQLITLNPQIKNPNLIYAGQVLTISKTGDINTTTAVAIQAEATKTYTVERGDSLFKIARRNGLTLEELKILNENLFAQKYIYAGQTVLLK